MQTLRITITCEKPTKVVLTEEKPEESEDDRKSEEVEKGCECGWN